jgi:hypothetical protein
MAELDPGTVTDIRKTAKRLLVRADALEVFPTPVDRIVEVAGLARSDEWLLDESKLKLVGAETRRLLRGLGRRLRGTLDRPDRVIYVDSTMDPNKQRFVALHETTHHVLPWQRAMSLFADDDVTLAPHIERQYEQEANQGAAELLFQVDLFARTARDYPTTLATPIELSQKIGASIHASIRRWVEGHEHALCVLVLPGEPTSEEPLRYRVKYAIESPLWRATFGSGALGRSVSAVTMPFLSTLTQPLGGDIDDVWQQIALDGVVRSLRVESFTNGYDVFVLFRVPARDRRAARRRGAATIVHRSHPVTSGRP